MRWLVTGGAGFIGSCFVDRLLAREDTECVIVVDKLTYAGCRTNLPEEHDKLVFVEADIAEPHVVHDVLKNHLAETIVNFAAETHVDRSIASPGDFLRTNVWGVYRILEAMLLLDSSIRLVQISTDEVFGSIDVGAFDEQCCYDPSSPYSASKASADHLIRAYARTYGLKCAITHAANNYGPRQYPEKLIPLALERALAHQPIPVYGDGKNVRDWLYVDDHCDAILHVIDWLQEEPDDRTTESWCIGAGEEHTNLDLLSRLLTTLGEMKPGYDYKRLLKFVPDRAGHDRRYALDTEKIREEIGWQPRHSLDEGLRTTIQWYLDHPGWFSRQKQKEYAL